MKILKYPIVIDDKQLIMMPKFSRILCAQVQNGDPYIWAAVDGAFPEVGRKIRLAGTGHDVTDVYGGSMTYKEDVGYIGTFQINDGTFVGHLFDMGEINLGDDANGWRVIS